MSVISALAIIVAAAALGGVMRWSRQDRLRDRLHGIPKVDEPRKAVDPLRVFTCHHRAGQVTSRWVDEETERARRSVLILPPEVAARMPEGAEVVAYDPDRNEEFMPIIALGGWKTWKQRFLDGAMTIKIHPGTPEGEYARYFLGVPDEQALEDDWLVIGSDLRRAIRCNMKELLSEHEREDPATARTD